MVEGVVLNSGDGRRKSDTQKLLFNSLRWLSEPSLQAGKPGGYRPKPKPPVVAAPEAVTQPVSWSDWKKEPIVGLDAPYKNYVGLIGAHSGLGGGRGTTEENIQAARQAGYDFIAFTEDLSRVDEKTIPGAPSGVQTTVRRSVSCHARPGADDGKRHAPPRLRLPVSRGALPLRPGTEDRG
jgi:hypothetical protein